MLFRSKSIANLLKELCLYSNKYTFNGTRNEITYLEEIAEHFKIHKCTARRYLQIGNECGWCNYKNTHDFKKEKDTNIYKYYITNNNCSSSDICKAFGYEDYYVKKILRQLSDSGKIDYTYTKRLVSVTVYDSKMNKLKQYDSYKECQLKSFEDFGIKFNKDRLSEMCRGLIQPDYYKGYYFTSERKAS